MSVATSQYSAAQVITLKIKGSQELGAWADTKTISKMELNITPFIKARSVEERLELSMPFSAKYASKGIAIGSPQMIGSITAQPANSISRAASQARMSCSAIS